MLSPSCGLWLWETKGCQRGVEKLEQTPFADQGVNENVEQTEQWEMGQTANTKGYSESAVMCVALSHSGLCIPDGIGGD